MGTARESDEGRGGADDDGHRVAAVGVFATPDHADVIGLTATPAAWVDVSDRFLIAPLVEAMLALQPERRYSPPQSDRCV